MSEAKTNQGPGPLEPVKRYLVKSIASGIGLASEGITSYKERKRLRRAGPFVDAAPPSYMPPSPGSSDEAATPPLSHHELSDDYKDEKLWTLDEAQDELSPPPYAERATTPDGSTGETTPAQSLQSIEDFLERYPAPDNSTAFTKTKLPQPVILPQKRPKTRSRGFIRAYAPCLGPCGIPQDMFLDFITTFDKSTQASPWLDAINLASIGLSFIPHFPMLVGIAIQVSIMAAKDVQNRTRTNSFLDKANAQVFTPRGLYCIIMTYSPDQDDRDDGNGRRLAGGANVPAAIASTASSTSLQRFQHRFREASGHTCEAELPPSAPLIFPCLEEGVSGREPQASGTPGERMKRAQRYITDYYDKRAQARFAGKHGGSGLVKGPAPSFTSRFADPNHPACSGSFRSLITGGYITPPDMGRGREELDRPSSPAYLDPGQGQAASWQQPPCPAGRRDAAATGRDVLRLGPVGLPTPGALVKKALKKNILYMMIVNMPSEQELALAAQHLERCRSKGISIASLVTHLQGR
ncbi:hypothetical protein MHUMG1_05932 [Metarhizium humberi]|uniref:FAD binding domain protein n=1 Tax=Metarhizium humberi TaxID=2596975 RepID=A0A9P8S781_9HYPO|nr:hypothetical protein MHUMG1_05932 [Metarhizium humberi]